MVFAQLPPNVSENPQDAYSTILSLYYLIENVHSVVPLADVTAISGTTYSWRLPTSSPFKTMRSTIENMCWDP